MDEATGLYEFVGFGELAETTTQLLALSLHHTAQTGGDPRYDARQDRRQDRSQVEQVVLRQAGDYLRQVREGFMLSVRTGQVTHTQEARFLLDRVICDWTTLSHELGLEEFDDSPPAVSGDQPEADAPQVQRVRHQLLAFGMAVVALGQLPRLPSKQVTFPHSYGNPPTYRDIPVPSSPGEMLWRIEELEQMVWRLMSDDLHDLVQRRYGPLRRTYGFFEAGAWISQKDAVRFGVKKRQKSLITF